MTRFLNESPWCPNRVTQKRHQFIMKQIKKSHTKKGDSRPIVFFIIDDSQCKKDRSTTHMEGLDYHFSHSDGKSVWSHCVVTAHIVCESSSFAWDYRSYFRKPYCEEHGLSFKSKNDLAMELIKGYSPTDDEQVYVLVDSWYTSRKLIDRCSQKGFHLIGGLRANRKIYPFGIGVKISEFASTFIQKRDLRSVTESGHTYKLFSYEGNLSDSENAKVLLSWEGEFDSRKTPFCILFLFHLKTESKTLNDDNMTLMYFLLFQCYLDI